MLEAPAFVFKQSVTAATPLLVAGFGELLAERAGVINIGIEGLMLMGAIGGYAAAVLTGSAYAAVPAAMLMGVLFAALFAVATVRFRADQIVVGTALNILAVGASTTAWGVLQRYMHPANLPPHEAPPLFDPVIIPWLHEIPLIGPALFGQYGLFYFLVFLGAAIYMLLKYTRFGLIVRALGDAPEAADAAGISVIRWRGGLVLFAGAMAGLAGAYLSTMRGHSFQVRMTGGQGFLVLALVIFGRWSIPGLVAGTLVFGAIDALQSYLTGIPGATQKIPHQLFDMLPYAATLIALGLLSKNTSAPIHLAKPWPPER
jgi:simple sugar transport system permease protein